MKVQVRVYRTNVSSEILPDYIGGLCIKLSPDNNLSFDQNVYYKNDGPDVYGWGLHVVSDVGEVYNASDIIDAIKDLQSRAAALANAEQLTKGNKWIVKSFGAAGSDVEISAVMVNTHGAGSWGWGGNDKIIVLRGKDIGIPVTPEMIKEAQDTAQAICEHKNKSL